MSRVVNSLAILGSQCKGFSSHAKPHQCLFYECWEECEGFKTSYVCACAHEHVRSAPLRERIKEGCFARRLFLTNYTLTNSLKGFIHAACGGMGTVHKPSPTLPKDLIEGFGNGRK